MNPYPSRVFLRQNSAANTHYAQYTIAVQACIFKAELPDWAYTALPARALGSGVRDGARVRPRHALQQRLHALQEVRGVTETGLELRHHGIFR